MEKIKIRCPFCGATLQVNDSPANAGKKITCPVCKHVGQFEEFKKVQKQALPEETQIPGQKDHVENATFFLIDKATGTEYKLSSGRNLIGRMTYKTAPKATVPIRTEDLGFSREHIWLEVMRAIDGIMYCFASNAANKNATYINGKELQAGDRTGLSNGDEIKSSDTVLILKKKTGPSGYDDGTQYEYKTQNEFDTQL